MEQRMNLRIEYMYRDGGNYKRRACVVFPNPLKRSAAEVTKSLEKIGGKWRLFEGTVHFRPETVGLSTCYFTDIGYAPNSDDLELHEIEAVEECADASTDGRTIDEFLADLERASA
jgi:hypothetical protein